MVIRWCELLIFFVFFFFKALILTITTVYSFQIRQFNRDLNGFVLFVHRTVSMVKRTVLVRVPVTQVRPYGSVWVWKPWIRCDFQIKFYNCCFKLTLKVQELKTNPWSFTLLQIKPHTFVSFKLKSGILKLYHFKFSSFWVRFGALIVEFKDLVVFMSSIPILFSGENNNKSRQVTWACMLCCLCTSILF